jgi:hypothetical protein
MLLKGTLIYLTGVYSTSTSMVYLRTFPRLRYTFASFDDDDIVAAALLWPVSIPFITIALMAVAPVNRRKLKEEEKKKEKRL